MISYFKCHHFYVPLGSGDTAWADVIIKRVVIIKDIGGWVCRFTLTVDCSSKGKIEVFAAGVSLFKNASLKQ